MAQGVKLTAMAKAAGCAAKMAPGLLDGLLRKLPPQTDPNVLVGFQTSDDAGIYKVSENLALVQTVDFFTPVADDPFLFGQIAATNALSDVYAMGGRPISALSLVGFPEKGDLAILEEILRGGWEKMAEAKCSIIGGHSIRNDDIQFGYAVTGLIDPYKIWRNVGAQTGDVLLFTKALGTGVISTAVKRERASRESVDAANASMTQLNRAGCEALREAESKLGEDCVHAVTDVTGFSLLGHSREMALGDPSNGLGPVSFELDHTAFRILPGALDAARDGMIPGGLINNREFIGDCVEFADSVAEEYRAILFDPQTAGGLLVAVKESASDGTQQILKNHGIRSDRVGRVLSKRSPLISVR